MLFRRGLLEELQPDIGTVRKEVLALLGGIAAIGVEGEADTTADHFAHLAGPDGIALRVEPALEFEECEALPHPASGLLDCLLLVEDADGHAGGDRFPRPAEQLPRGLTADLAEQVEPGDVERG